MEIATQELLAELEQRGYRGRVVSIRRLQDMRSWIESLNNQGLFDKTFYRDYLGFFRFTPPAELPGAASLIVVAVPRPQTRVSFTRHDKIVPLIIPPTYVGYHQVPQQVSALLAELLASDGHRLARAMVPIKTLAVCSGLADYGRNNITYVSGMGSFHHLIAVFSDLPCAEDEWREPRLMERCASCAACRHACPTSAIPADRVLLHAERCLVYHNERGSEHPFPNWIDKRAHNAVIGCMLCQRVCPENKPYLERIEGNETFSEEETALLLAGVTAQQLPASTADKLRRVDLLDSLNVLPRNLDVLL